MKKLLILILIFTGAAAQGARPAYRLTSPDGRLTTTVALGDALTYDIEYDGQTLMQPSAIGLKLSDGRVWGSSARIAKAVRTSSDAVLSSPFYRSSTVRDHYNGLTLKMRDNWSVEFRVYDDGVAYRFATTAKDPFEIASEQADYRFPTDCAVTVPYVRDNAGSIDAQWHNSFENVYTETTLSKLDSGRLIFLPAVVHANDGMNICFTETNLDDYPGMYLYNGDGGTSLEGRFAPYPLRCEPGGYNNIEVLVKERADYIARIEGPRTLPWRIAVVGTDAGLAASDLSWLLAEPSKIDDTSWIRPGKVAWDWWNAWNISGVDFRAGINTETYEYYIDFAASQGIEYVIMDDGWAARHGEDLFEINTDIDLRRIIDYAASKNVGIILWAGYWAFDRDMERVCKHYAEMGVKGFKVDFMDRDDQLMTAFNYRAAETAARYGLVLDLHGTHKPAGLNRTWPNVLNFEGVHGLEQMKWSAATIDQMKYDATIPFIRQVAGPMDYTQGAMRNASRDNYRPVNSEPMSQGTRCHQLALYAVLDSPLNMLCDSPSNYMREPECTEFIASVPTTWDETVGLDGRVGEYVSIARRKGDTWYVGGMTDWNARTLTIDLGFLGEGAYTAELFRDGVNADKAARDYKRESVEIPADRKLTVKMAPGGGFALKITRK